MKAQKIIIIVILINLIIPRICCADDTCKYINLVLNFYKNMQGCKQHKISDYYDLFGKNNEAELEMILRKRFKSQNNREELNRNNDIVNQVNAVLNNPTKYDSEFLKLLCTSNVLSLNKNIERSIVFPIQETKDFIQVKVLEGNKKIIFEFSRGESSIENIYLPDGKSIYSLTEQSW